uniref:Uncharacterized protein n=1 Tax=Anguilla anguilla TaxID=7936 RepID=A0A0E9WQX1_ANGAN
MGLIHMHIPRFKTITFYTLSFALIMIYYLLVTYYVHYYIRIIYFSFLCKQTTMKTFQIKSLISN